MGQFKEHQFDGQTALIRVDFNVPLNEHHEVTDDKRIRATLPTLRKILKDGGACILMAHLGRPKGDYQEEFSFKHILNKLEELLGQPVQFAPDCIGEEARQKAQSLQPGEVLMLENLRFHPEEKEGEAEFARQLAGLADVYVNDAFGAAHRAHASISEVPKHFDPDQKMAGLLIEKECKHIDHLMGSPQKPFTAIIGGAKVSDKIQLIEKLITKVDHLLIGGGMTYTFLKAQGNEIGQSIVEENRLDTARSLLQQAEEGKSDLRLPVDSVIAPEISDSASPQEVSNDSIPDDQMGLDIGSNTIDEYRPLLVQSQKILWNGPMGVYECPPFANGTRQIGEIIAATTQNNAYSLVGGGETVAALEKFGLEDQMSFVSTGGGALLTYIQGETLPGLAALEG